MTLTPTIDEQLGQVLAVYEVQSGGTLAVDLVGGATTITVVDPADFHELGGELFAASGDDAAITSEVVRYNATDLIGGVITLAVPWPTDWPTFAAGDYVWCSPLATERRVDVALDGEADQLVTARLPYTIAAQVPVGVRPPDAGEWLRVAVTELGYAVVDVENEYPSTDPASVQILDPDTGEVVGELGGDAAFDTVTADEVLSPSVPYRQPDDALLYVDAVNGDDDNDGTAIPALLDLFERTVAPTSWGIADTLQPWVIGFNSGNLIDVNAGAGRLRTNGGGQFVFMRSGGFAPLDVEVYGRLAVSGTPNGQYQLELVARGWESPSQYVLTLNYNSAGSGTLTPILAMRSASTYTNLAVGAVLVTGGAYFTQDYEARFQVQTNPDGGTDLRGKVWIADTAEPDGWMLTANDSTAALQQPGPVGINLRSGAAATNNVIGYTKAFTAAVIDAGGLLVDTTVGGVGPLQTVAEAIARCGDWLEGTVRILLSGTVDEQVNIVGLGGGGRLILDGGNTATLYGTVNVVRCPCYVELRQFTLQDTGDVAAPNANAGSVEVQASAYVYCYSLSVQSNTSRTANIWYAYGAHGKVEASQLNGATGRCIDVVYASLVYAVDNKGLAPGNAHRVQGALLITSGTQPTGGNGTAGSGQIFTTGAGGTPPAGTGGSAPPTSTKKTVTVNADSSCTWRPAWGWRTDNDEIYQGEYAGSGGLSRGVAFFGNKLVKAGKNADSGKVYVKRAGYGGASQSQTLYLCSFAQGTKPGGSPTIVDGPRDVGGLAWGAGKWIDLPASWVQHFLDGTAKSIGLYHGSASPYVICDGRKNGTTRFQIKMTYH